MHRCIRKNKFNTKERGASKRAGIVAIATFATISNPVLLLCYTFSHVEVTVFGVSYCVPCRRSKV